MTNACGSLQLAYGQASGVEPVEISRMVHSLDTNADGLINFREMVALLFSGQQQQQQQQQ
jgi:hypothetical protein